jgi:hypothetical protein
LISELNILLLSWFKSSTNWKDIKDLVDWKNLVLLSSTLAFIFFLDGVKLVGLFLEEAPLVVNSHFGDVGENDVLLL